MSSPYRDYRNNPGYVRHMDGVVYRYNNSYKQYTMCGVAKLAERLHERADSDDAFHLLDMLDIFADFSGEAYTDYCHLTPQANAHVAQKIADYLVANGVITTSTTASAADVTPTS